MAGSSRDIFVSTCQGPYVSQSALVSILRKSFSRKSVKRARDAALPDTTPLGPLWGHVTVETTAGGQRQFPVALPMPMLWLHASECAGFARFLAHKLGEHPNSARSRWNVALYADEVLPGNALKATNLRKFISFYWSWCEFDSALGSESVWFHLCCLRVSFLKDIKCGISQLFKQLTRLFFTAPTSLRDGVMLSIGQSSAMFFGQLGLVVADEVALKQLWSFRGASATLPCFFCRNLCSWSSQLHEHDDSGSLVPLTVSTLDAVVQHTNETLLEAASLLLRRKPALSKTAFTSLEQSVGLTFSPEGALWSNGLFNDMRGGGPLTCTQYDWMHCFLVSGIWNTEAGLLFGALAGTAANCVSFDSWLQSCVWPKSLSSRGVTGKQALKKRTATDSSDVKTSASEGLTLYPLLRLFLMETLEAPDASVAPAVQSYYALSRVLDLLVRLRNHSVDSSELRAAISAHLQRRLLVYGPSAFTPKCHYALHFPSFVDSHGRLVACWTHERKHKEVKRHGNQLANANKSLSFEKSLLSQAVLSQLLHLKEFSAVGGVQLVAPQDASSDIASSIMTFLGEDAQSQVSASLEAMLKHGELCARGDVVLAHSSDEGKFIGMVWFHVSISGAHFTLLARWHALGRNVFKMLDAPSWVETVNVSRTCVYRVHKDMVHASVAP